MFCLPGSLILWPPPTCLGVRVFQPIPVLIPLATEMNLWSFRQAGLSASPRFSELELWGEEKFFPWTQVLGPTSPGMWRKLGELTQYTEGKKWGMKNPCIIYVPEKLAEPLLFPTYEWISQYIGFLPKLVVFYYFCLRILANIKPDIKFHFGLVFNI